jgi:O-antigen/teichoic acid export membrane protein
MASTDTSPEMAPHGAADPRRASRRVAVGALARSLGEVVGKLASLVLYVAIARKLGNELFGDFVFGISLATILLLGAGLGMQELVAREVARDHKRVDDLFWNVTVVKSLMLLALLGVIAAVVAFKGYSLEIAAAIVIIGLSVGLEYQANTVFAVFQGFERNHHIATSLIVNRTATTGMALAVLAAGGGLLPVAIVAMLGSAFGVALAYVLMRRYVVRPQRHVDPGAWKGLIRQGFPLGLITALNRALLGLSVVMLGFVASSAEVGFYGAAFRLIEATMWISWAISGALLPWFSRHTGQGDVSIARGFEVATKTVIAILLPLSLILFVYAEPVIETLYGSEFDDAVTPLRLLSGMAVLFGLNSLMTTVLIGRDEPGRFTRPAAAVFLQNVIFNLILIPPYGADGAAINAVLSAALLTALTFRNVTRLLGSVSVVRLLVAPLGAGAALMLAVAALEGLPWIPAAIAGIAVYSVAFLTLERLFFPGDFAFYSGVVRPRGPASAPT